MPRKLFLPELNPEKLYASLEKRQKPSEAYLYRLLMESRDIVTEFLANGGSFTSLMEGYREQLPDLNFADHAFRRACRTFAATQGIQRRGRKPAQKSLPWYAKSERPRVYAPRIIEHETAGSARPSSASKKQTRKKDSIGWDEMQSLMHGGVREANARRVRSEGN